MAGQTSCDMGPLPEQQGGEAKAEATARRKARRARPVPPWRRRRGEPARAPTGDDGEERGETARAPSGKDMSPSPPLKEWLPDIPKTGGRRGSGRRGLELKAPEAESLELET